MMLTTDLPLGYAPGPKRQPYVDRPIAGFTAPQRARLGQLWEDKQRIHLNMANRGVSFVKILEDVANNGE